MNDEPARAFVDTNILVYALAADDPRRSSMAERLMNHLMRTNTFCTSTQVLQELYVTLTRKVETPFSPKRALESLDWIANWHIEPSDYSLVRAAADLSARAQLSLWDSLIVIAAKRSDARRLYTEDLSHGQIMLGVEIVNPFRG
jgi:predicted nucleic acid-binding protein